MKTVLLISSQAASSRIGASASAFAFERSGIEVITLPTVIVGRHPGWGDPGLVEIDADGLSRLFLAVQAQGILDHIDAVVTGYFHTSRQVTAAAAMIDYVRKAKPDVKIIIDPVMGDEPEGLYVREAVADAIVRTLLPRADVITPNAWELAYLADHPVFDEASAVGAARHVGCELALVSSIRSDTNCTTMAVTQNEAWCVSVPCYKDVPKGTGDLLMALFSAHILNGLPVNVALENAVSAVDTVLGEAMRMGARELPLVATQDRLVNPRTGVTARPPLQSRKTGRWVAGLDGCPGGWIAVLLDVAGQYAPRLMMLRSFWDIMNVPERPQIVAVDMPIGFAEVAKPGGRGCDVAARGRLGARKSGVFSPPCRRALYTTSYENACNANAQSGENAPKLSKQVYSLFDKMREIDARISPDMQSRIFEVHPEFSFSLLRTAAPCEHPKKTDAGRAERLQALEKAGFDKDFLQATRFTPFSDARPDDFLDACASAWSAQRILLGASETLPKDPESDANGLEMAIRA